MPAGEAFSAGQQAEDAGDFIGAAAAYGALRDDPDPEVAATARLHLGRVAWKQGRMDDALSLCDEARAIAIRIGNQDLRARVENAVGVLHYARGEYAQARAAYSVAQELSSDPATRAKIALNLGVIANIQGNLEQARRYYAQSLATCRDARDHRGEALALHNIGMLHADRAEWDEAEEAFRGALGLFEHHGDRQMIGNVLINRSEVGYGRGRVHEAIAQCDLALSMYAEIGDEAGRGEGLRWKAHGLRRLRRLTDAAHALNDAIRIAQRLRIQLLEAEATRELAWVRRDEGSRDEAVRLLRAALAQFTALGAAREAREIEAELATLA